MADEVKLVKYDAMCRAIEECGRIDEVKEFRDRMIAYQHYHRVAGNPEPERQACMIRIRAERRAGQLLKAMKRSELSKGGNTKSGGRNGPPSEYSEAIEKSGISKREAKRWQQLGEVQKDEF